MNQKRGVLFFIAALLSFMLACYRQNDYKVEDFTEHERMWCNPFKQTDSTIFISSKGELDTLVFSPTVAASDSSRSFEVGYSNTNYLTVQYSFTKGSYHQSAVMGDGVKRYDHHFVNIAKSSSGYTNLEITFIGIIFSGEQLGSIKKISENEYFFDSYKATYPWVNVEKPIRNFTFNAQFGIVNFTDERGVKWMRKNGSG